MHYRYYFMWGRWGGRSIIPVLLVWHEAHWEIPPSSSSKPSHGPIKSVSHTSSLTDEPKASRIYSMLQAPAQRNYFLFLQSSAFCSAHLCACASVRRLFSRDYGRMGLAQVLAQPVFLCLHPILFHLCKGLASSTLLSLLDHQFP